MPDLPPPLHTIADPASVPVAALSALVDHIRPRRGDDPEAPARRLGALLEALEQDPARAAGLRAHVLGLLSSCRLVGFFADSGLLPLTGFFTELGRIVTDRLLPALPDDQDLRGALRQVFHERSDWRWLEQLPVELSARLWLLVVRDDLDPMPALQAALDQMLEAVLVLAYRIGGLDVGGEFGTLGPEYAAYAARFRGLAGAAQHFVDSQRGAEPEDSKELQVLADQCTEVLQRAHRSGLRRGTSLRMTYTLRRTEQSLRRLLDLAHLVDASRAASASADGAARARMLEQWAALVHDALAAESQRRSLSTHLYGGLSMLALRVTDNAAKTGEHYIADTRSAYYGMWRSAMGAGLIIGFMALLKVFAGKVHGSLAAEALMYSLIYGGGFVAIYMLHLTVATKQPAMTAQTIAGSLGQAKKGRLADLDRLVDLVTGVVRSQFAAILGNVVVALPTAIALYLGLTALLGHPPFDTAKASAMLGDLDIAGWALPHAALAGVFLFLSGVLSGYFDNKASYARVGERIGRLGWLGRLLGGARAQAVGDYVEGHLGGLMGNFLFGCMLGTAGTIGTILGLPIDIRHIAFSSANLGFAWAAFDFALPWQTLGWALLGVALIGATNLAVSFSLALWMALRARGIAMTQMADLRRRLWARFRAAPASFFTSRGLE